MPMPYFCGSRPSSSANFADQLLGQRAARAFGDERVLAAQFHAAHEAVLGLAVAPDAHVARGDADHGAIVVIKHFRRREPG